MNDTRLTMIRSNLDGIPQHPLPAGFSIRWWRAGDRETWVRIHDLAEKFVPATAAVYGEQFAGNEVELARRQAFLLDGDGCEIGTGTAWFDNNYQGQRFGRVHWLAIVPEFQGHGLAKPLLSAVCNRLVELGHERAYLTTSTARLPAIGLYLSFGFVPEILTEDHRVAWQAVLKQLRDSGGG